MKKINIKYDVISNEKNVLETKGIFKNNEIIFYDGKVKNKIKLIGEKVIIERSSDYFLKLEFIMGKKTKATYTIGSISYNIDVFTSFLKNSKNEILINYNLNNDKTLEFKVKIFYDFCD